MVNNSKLCMLIMSLFLSACTGKIINYGTCANIDLNRIIAVIPFSNHTVTPLAGKRAMSITASLLQSCKTCNLVVYRKSQNEKLLFPGMNKIEPRAKLMQWARRKDAGYVLTGSVNEWTYKVGLDGEPVVGVSLQLIDLKTRKIAWSAVGSSSGGSRVALTTTAQALISSLLCGLHNSKCGFSK